MGRIVDAGPAPGFLGCPHEGVLPGPKVHREAFAQLVHEGVDSLQGLGAPRFRGGNPFPWTREDLGDQPFLPIELNLPVSQCTRRSTPG